MGTGGRSRWISPGAPGSRVTRLELFYDLVFVFAFLNVTTLTSAELDVRGLLEAFFVLALLWWCWSAFAAVGNVLRADQGIMPGIGFAVMAAVFVLAMTTAVAFRDEPGGLPGPVVFAAAYLMTWLLKMTALWWAAGGGWPPSRGALLLAVPAFGGAGLILAAAILPQRLVAPTPVEDVRLGIWSAALLVEYSIGVLLCRGGWRLRSMGHWAERHALIVLIALGESIIALGTGATIRAGRPISWPIIVGAVLGIAVIAALWWLYFDVVALALEQTVHGVRGPERMPLVRDVYSYLHLPLIVGIMFFALGLKRLLADVTDLSTPAGQDELGGLDVLVLYGGVVLYLLALLGIGLRAFRWFGRAAIVGSAVLVALMPLATRIPELPALGVLAGVCLVLVIVQVGSLNAIRRRVREAAQSEQEALEAEANEWRGRHL